MTVLDVSASAQADVGRATTGSTQAAVAVGPLLQQHRRVRWRRDLETLETGTPPGRRKEVNDRIEERDGPGWEKGQATVESSVRGPAPNEGANDPRRAARRTRVADTRLSSDTRRLSWARRLHCLASVRTAAEAGKHWTPVCRTTRRRGGPQVETQTDEDPDRVRTVYQHSC